jgi:hypothetical protein
MSWDDSDSDFFDGFSTGMWFFNGPWWLYLLIILIVVAILYYT